MTDVGQMRGIYLPGLNILHTAKKKKMNKKQITACYGGTKTPLYLELNAAE